MRRIIKISPVFTGWVAVLVVAGILSALLAACGTSGGYQSSLKMAPMGQMPEEIQQAPAQVLESYQFAATNPDVLKQIPCYCGCSAAGHTSNYDCYVKSASSNGEITFDGHALGCSICVDITQDTMRLLKEGKTVKEIRAYVDGTYARYGSSNMPPAAP